MKCLLGQGDVDHHLLGHHGLASRLERKKGDAEGRDLRNREDLRLDEAVESVSLCMVNSSLRGGLLLFPEA